MEKQPKIEKLCKFGLSVESDSQNNDAFCVRDQFNNVFASCHPKALPEGGSQLVELVDRAYTDALERKGTVKFGVREDGNTVTVFDSFDNPYYSATFNDASFGKTEAEKICNGLQKAHDIGIGHYQSQKIIPPKLS